MNRARYAIYFSPEAGTPLDNFGTSWIGRSCYSGSYASPYGLSPQIDALRQKFMADPYRYGFHATLKPPFHLRRDTSQNELTKTLQDFARERAPFWVPPFVVNELGSFLALVPSIHSPLLDSMAEDCVRAFDMFRAAPSESELAKRSAAGLTVRQQSLLTEWGYPFVMEEFRFHMTLTGRICNDDERLELKNALTDLWAELASQPVLVDAVSLFVQEEADQPFYVLDRFAFRV